MRLRIFLESQIQTASSKQPARPASRAASAGTRGADEVKRHRGEGDDISPYRTFVNETLVVNPGKISSERLTITISSTTGTTNPKVWFLLACSCIAAVVSWYGMRAQLWASAFFGEFAAVNDLGKETAAAKA